MKFYPDIAEKIDGLEHYSLKKVFSYNLPFMYLIGGRRYGKTYSVKMKLFLDFVNKGKKFAWVRSTDKMLDRIRQAEQFFGRMRDTFQNIGIENYAIKNDVIYINGKIAGYLFAIDTYYNIKGSDYEVETVVWDEFMRAKGERLVVGRREKFFDLLESIARDDGKRVFLLSNSTNQFDEVLQPFNITLREYGCYVYREKGAVIHYIRTSKTHKKNMEDSLSGLGMTDQEKKMAFNNQFTDYGDYDKVTRSQYLYTIQIDDNAFISLYSAKDCFYIKPSCPPDANIVSPFNEFVNSKVRKLSSSNLKFLRMVYGNGKVVFADGYCRTYFQSIIK